MIHLLPGSKEINFEVIAQHINVAIAMTGIAAQTGITELGGELLDLEGRYYLLYTGQHTLE